MISDTSNPPENSGHAFTACHLDRRGFLQALAAAAGVALISGCGEGGNQPAVVAPIIAEAVGKEFKIPGAQNLKSGEALAFTLPDQAQTPGLVFVSSRGQLKALSAKCTHIGCTVLWQDSAELQCPCHGSRFDLNGKVLTGPATKPLPVFVARKVGEDVLIKPAK